MHTGDEAANARVDWDVIRPDRIRAVNHEQLAGLQLADAVASAVYFAVNRNPYGEIEDRYLRLMAPTIYLRKEQGVLVPDPTKAKRNMVYHKPLQDGEGSGAGLLSDDLENKKSGL